MNISETSDLFKKLKTKTEKKNEIKIYENFIKILLALESKDLTKNQRQSIEKKLETLKLNVKPTNHKKYFKRKLTEFMKYLKDEHSFVPEKYYLEMGMGIGMCWGVALGGSLSVFNLDMESNPIVFGLIIGMCIGMFIGTNMDTKAKKEGRVLKNTKYKTNRPIRDSMKSWQAR